MDRTLTSCCKCKKEYAHGKMALMYGEWICPECTDGMLGQIGRDAVRGALSDVSEYIESLLDKYGGKIEGCSICETMALGQDNEDKTNNSDIEDSDDSLLFNEIDTEGLDSDMSYLRKYFKRNDEV